ncbi:MAG: alkaline phosphatase [Thermodesulfovibrionales bacterium]|nr:alkaline phosphatase [Thermodesulfovibrionales bacterium]
MGTEQVKAGALYTGGPLSFEGFPRTGTLNTASAESIITDSAAAATAMAAGMKVMNGVLSIRLPGDARKLETVLELFKAEGKSVGLVTTTYVTHATPAAFASHAASRSDFHSIAQQYLGNPLPEVLMGGSKHVTPKMASKAGYYVVTNKEELGSPDADKAKLLAGLFGKGHMPYERDATGDLPHLSEMVEAAIEILSQDPDGFFLMVEGGRIDHAGHANDIERLVAEVAEFSNSVSAVLQWTARHPDTLMIVTADHETGGLRVLEESGSGHAPRVSWATSGHTAALVPVYARGPGAERIQPVMDNTEIHRALLGQGDYDR